MTTDASLPANAVYLSNAQMFDMTVWLEPWCEEFKLAPHAKLGLVAEGGDAPEIEALQDRLVAYGAAGTCVRVYIDDLEQDTGAATLTVPGGGNLSTKDFVQLVFGDFPEARSCGAPAPRPHFLRRLFPWGRK